MPKDKQDKNKERKDIELRINKEVPAPGVRLYIAGLKRINFVVASLGK
jgi:uncharacterized membrane protein